MYVELGYLHRYVSFLEKYLRTKYIFFGLYRFLSRPDETICTNTNKYNSPPLKCLHDLKYITSYL